MEKQKTIQEHAQGIARESNLISYRANKIEELQGAGVSGIELQNELADNLH